MRLKRTINEVNLNVLALCDSRAIIPLVGKLFVSKLRPKNVPISSSDLWLTGYQDWNSSESCFSSWKVSTVDNCAVLFARKTHVGWPDCGAAIAERRLPTLEELAKSYLKSIQGSSGSFITQFMKSEDKVEPGAVKSNMNWDLSNPLPAEKVSSLATTATSIADNKLSNHLKKWHDIKSYAANLIVTVDSKSKPQAIKTLEQTTGFNVKDTKLDFCAERTKWSYRTVSTLQWASSSP